MDIYGIIGYPLTYSFSRQYFTEKIEREQIQGAVYHSFPLESIEDLPGLLKQFPELKGLSVTIPYKEQVLPYVTRLSAEVEAIGAANCIRIRQGELTAYNTDIIGFEKSFIKKREPHHNQALVLGTGGASKAVQYVLKKLGINFLVVSREPDAGALQIAYSSIDEALLNSHTVIINCTPLGMSPEEDTCPELPYHLLTPQHYLFDLVYKPAKTLYLQRGENQGCVIENGFEMLILQAEENWQRWNES